MTIKAAVIGLVGVASAGVAAWWLFGAPPAPTPATPLAQVSAPTAEASLPSPQRPVQPPAAHADPTGRAPAAAAPAVVAPAPAMTTRSDASQALAPHPEPTQTAPSQAPPAQVGPAQVAPAHVAHAQAAAAPSTSSQPGPIEATRTSPAPTRAEAYREPAAEQPAATPSDPAAPSFDVARVGARGTTVVAGRATPGAEVRLLDGGRELGSARADARGEWVILPADPLAAGARELTLRARLADGREVNGTDTVLVVIPERAPAVDAAPAAQTPLVALLPPSAAAAAPRLLQGAAEPGSAGGTPAPLRLSLDIVDYDSVGAIRFAGTAPPGSSVRVYVDEQHAGDAVSSQEGRWALTPSDPPAVGQHMLRLDQLTAAGRVVASRIEVPFVRESLPDGGLANGRVVVQPGSNLWRIARHAYGRGIRYTVIYQANRGQIRDPALIFPGQIFSVPGF